MPYGKDKGDVMRKKVGKKSRKSKKMSNEYSHAAPMKSYKKKGKRTWEGNSGVDDGSHAHFGH